jgi:hypothetical protein
MATLRVFHYLPELDAFRITDELQRISDELGLSEWHAAVWIGRLFTMDNDFGEHWFDNWDEREAREAHATQLGLDTTDLMIVVPDRFQDGRDGPCHSPALRKAFWTDVLCSLELNYDVIFEAARENNKRIRDILPDAYMKDLDIRIARIQARLEE